MKDSNKKLQDASDVITHYITDKVEPVIKVASAGGAGDNDDNSLGPGGFRLGLHSNQGSASNSRRGSILSEYLNNNQEEDGDCDLESMASSNGGGNGGVGKYHKQANSSAMPTSKLLKKMNGLETSLSRNGRFNQSTTSSSSTNTMNDNLYLNVPQNQHHNLKRNSKSENKLGTTTTTTIAALSDPQQASTKREQDPEFQARHRVNTIEQQQAIAGANDNNKLTTRSAHNELQEQQQQQQQQSNSRTSLKNIGRHFLLGGRTQSEPKPKDPGTGAATATASATDIKSASADQADEPSVEPADGPSVATFNIILVGDSFVGKSSFAARFIEGNFVQGLISNCSIDFKTKTYKVDGINYTVNLWDTAGQERFRSITASYFRKADGIILMYDVTEKRSYLNVRNWMSTISDTAAENVAVLLVGNKIDLRLYDNKNDCVPSEEGFRLAKEYGIVFLETSVKTGANLLPSMGKLLRLIAKNNTAKDEDSDRIRLSDKGRTFNCMPKNC